MSASSVSFDKNVFYGRNRTKNLSVGVRVERQVRTNRAKHTPIPYRSRLIGPCSSWEVFYRQHEAFEFIHKSNKNDLLVWSFESEAFLERCGQRLYLATSLQKFWHYYIQLPREQRHHYEIIPQGSSCKLYFDLEYSQDLNPGLNGPRMVHIFIQYICYQLKKVYDLSCNGDDVLHLDAGLPTKFSRHLIFPRQYVFQDTDAAGGFVKYCCSELQRMVQPSPSHLPDSPASSCDHLVIPLKCDCPRTKELLELAELGLTDKDLKSLIVFDKEGREMIFCDQGVYTKNRNFRLYLSCKLGKVNPFILPEERYPSLPHTDEEHQKIFTESLITIKSDEVQGKLLTWVGDRKERAGRRSIQCKPASAEGSKTKSPYPEVDGFILSIVSRGGCQGNIRRWTYFSDSEVLTYDIVGNRYCHNIGRPHRSNNIMMLADLRQGVYYQKCHDPDCKAANYKSKEWALPRSVLPVGILEDDDNFNSADTKASAQMDDWWNDDSLDFLDEACLQAGHAAEKNSQERGIDDEDDDFLVRAAENAEKSPESNDRNTDKGIHHNWPTIGGDVNNHGHCTPGSYLGSELGTDIDDDAELLTVLESFEKNGTQG